MREIKFRAWHKENEEYWGIKSILFDEQKLELYEWGSVAFDEVIIEQYTGMKDVNGKEIYKGDLFKIKHGYKWKKESYFEVAFSRSFGYILRNKNGDWFPLKAKAKEYEVIGNIHDEEGLRSE